EAAGVVLDALRAQRLQQHQVLVEVADYRAVLRPRIEYLVGRRRARGPRRVLDDHVRVAREVLSEVAGHQPRVGVEAAARREADDDPHGLAAVEAGHARVGARAGRRDRRRRAAEQGGGRAGHAQEHQAHEGGAEDDWRVRALHGGDSSRRLLVGRARAGYCRRRSGVQLAAHALRATAGAAAGAVAQSSVRRRRTTWSSGAAASRRKRATSSRSVFAVCASSSACALISSADADISSDAADCCSETAAIASTACPTPLAAAAISSVPAVASSTTREILPIASLTARLRSAIVPAVAAISSTWRAVRSTVSRMAPSACPAWSASAEPTSTWRAPWLIAATASRVLVCTSRISSAMVLVSRCERSASLRTSSATTAKPRPCSPARAASIAAFSASRF